MNELYPVFAMVGLTFFCMLRMGQLRYLAVKRGEVDPRFFALYRGYEEPEKLAVYSRHVVNLLEAPVLFYVIMLAASFTNQASMTIVGLAWAYVALRFIHSWVHLTSNVIIVRFRVYLLSMLVLIALWAVVLTGVMRQ